MKDGAEMVGNSGGRRRRDGRLVKRGGRCPEKLIFSDIYGYCQVRVYEWKGIPRRRVGEPRYGRH